MKDHIPLKVRLVALIALSLLSTSLYASDITISIDDIVAGNAVQLSGDVDMSSSVLRITGSDFSALDRNRSYDIAFTKGGTFTGASTMQIVCATLPTGWKIRVRGSRITLRATSGRVRVLLEGAK